MFSSIVFPSRPTKFEKSIHGGSALRTTHFLTASRLCLVGSAAFHAACAQSPDDQTIVSQADTQGAGMAERLRRIADTTRASAQIHEDDLSARNAAIYEASAAGWSLAEIARATRLDKSRVHRIIVELEARAWARVAEAAP